MIKKLLLVSMCALALVSNLRSQTIQGCAVFPADNPWNQDISALPLHPMSATYLAHFNTAKKLHPDFGSDTMYGIPFEVVHTGQPFVHVTYTDYPDQSDTGWMPVPPDAHVEGGNPVSNNGDRHILIVDVDNHKLYECWRAFKDAADINWKAANGAIFDLSSNHYRPDGWTSGDAAGLPIFPGLVRYDEIQAGAINHAVRFTVAKTQKGWITPARHQAGSGDTTYAPMGLRLRLKASFDLSTFSGGPKVLLVALKKYGMILADNGSDWYITGATDARWSDNEWNALKTVPGTAFEAVYTGPTKHVPDNSSVASEIRPESVTLGANYPNPFTRETTIDFTTLEAGHALVEVYDMLGRKIVTLASGVLDPGDHSLEFHARNLQSGTYIVRLQLGSVTKQRMIQLVK
jgi:hypothetical protein